MEKRSLAHIAALFTMVVWGATFVSTKVLLEHLTPFQILFCRTVLGFLALCLVRPRFLHFQRPKHELYAAVAGLTGVFGYYLAENTALQFADASFVSIVVSTAPLFTATLSFAVLKEKGFGVRFVAGFLIAIAGIALISLQEGPAHASALGAALSLVAAAVWAVYSVVVKQLSSFGYETIALTKRIFAWGLACMVVMHVATGGEVPLDEIAQPIVLGNLAFLGILASAVCFITWNFGIKHLGAASTSAYIYLQAPLTVVWAVLLLSEPFNAAIVIGIALVIVGLALSEGFDRRIVAKLAHRGRNRT